MTFQRFWNSWDAYNIWYNITSCSGQDHYLVLKRYKGSRMSQKGTSVESSGAGSRNKIFEALLKGQHRMHFSVVEATQLEAMFEEAENVACTYDYWKTG